MMEVEQLQSPDGSADSDAGDSLFLGNDEDFDRTFLGRLDDVRLYDEILTPGEIGALSDAPWVHLIM